MYEYAKDLKLAEEKNKNITQKLFDREFCSFVYSNNDTDSMRINLLEKLSTYKRVDSGGKLKNNLLNGQVEDKLLLRIIINSQLHVRIARTQAMLQKKYFKHLRLKQFLYTMEIPLYVRTSIQRHLLIVTNLILWIIY